MNEKQPLPFARSFRDLLVYQRQRALALVLFEATKSWPAHEREPLTDELLLATRRIGAHIAKAWAKRDEERSFIGKLSDADGEQQATQHWIEIAYDCGYLEKKTAEPLLQRCAEIGRMLQSMKSRAGTFCNASTHLREDAEEDFAPLGAGETPVRSAHYSNPQG